LETPHFVNQGLEFFAPHPQQLVPRLDTLPKIHTPRRFPKCWVRTCWGFCRRVKMRCAGISLFNEIQMLLSRIRLTRLASCVANYRVNSVCCAEVQRWAATVAQSPYHGASSDEILVEYWPPPCTYVFEICRAMAGRCVRGTQLLVWAGLRSALQRGDLAGWHSCSV